MDDYLIRPKDAIAWVLWRRLREPSFMAKFPFTLDDLRKVDPETVATIDAAFHQSPEDRAKRRGAELRTSTNDPQWERD